MKAMTPRLNTFNPPSAKISFSLRGPDSNTNGKLKHEHGSKQVACLLGIGYKKLTKWKVRQKAGFGSLLNQQCDTCTTVKWGNSCKMTRKQLLLENLSSQKHCDSQSKRMRRAIRGSSAAWGGVERPVLFKNEKNCGGDERCRLETVLHKNGRQQTKRRRAALPTWM